MNREDLTGGGEKTVGVSMSLVVFCTMALMLAGGAPGAETAGNEGEQQQHNLRWVEITPLVGDAPVRLLLYPQDDAADEVVAEGAGRQLLCAGGERDGSPWAVTCREYMAENGTMVPLSWSGGVEVTGRVWVDREPAAGAVVSVVPADLRTVRFRAMPLWWNEKSETLVRHLEAGQDGRFRLPALAPGEYLLALQLPGGRLVHSAPIEVPDPASLRRKEPPASKAVPAPVLDIGDLVFEGGATVRVWTLDTDGLPIAGARVVAVQEGAEGQPFFFHGQSDPDGIARLSGLVVEPVRLECGGEGFRWYRQTYELPPAEHLCQLEALAEIQGTVVDPEGEPVEATVRLAGRGASRTNVDESEVRLRSDGPPGDDLIQRQPIAADREGDFAFRELPAGHYELTVSAPGFATARVQAELEPGEQSNLAPITLRHGQDWEGIVVDGSTGEPVAGARVRAVDPPGAVAAVADEEGHFWAITGVAEPLDLEVEAAGYPRTVAKVAVEDLTGDAPVLIEIDRGGFLEIQYWTAEGEPCGGCSVSVLGPGVGRELQTDAGGFAQTEALPPGRYQVTPVKLESFGGVVSRSGGSRNRFAVVRPGAVERVVIGERQVEVEIEVRPAPPPGWRLRISGASAGELHEFDAGGRAVIRWPPGPVRVTLSKGQAGSVDLARLEAAPRDGTLTLDLPTGLVTGRIVRDGPDAGGSDQVALVDVFSGQEWARTRTLTNAGGRFEFQFVPPGNYAVILDDQVVRTVVLESGAEDLGDLTVVPVSGQ